MVSGIDFLFIKVLIITVHQIYGLSIVTLRQVMLTGIKRLDSLFNFLELKTKITEFVTEHEMANLDWIREEGRLLSVFFVCLSFKAPGSQNSPS